MSVIRLVAATANRHKVDEIRAILGAEIELVDRPASLGPVIEDGATLEDNARLKAVAVCSAAGEAAVADDTGLEVDALDGAPGVHSARYGGVDGDAAANTARLLDELSGVVGDDRTARFRTVALVRWPDGSEVVAHGVVEGRILSAPAGVEGFGYDPVFAPDGGGGRSFAEMNAAEKHAVSHRGRAFRALAANLGLPG